MNDTLFNELKLAAEKSLKTNRIVLEDIHEIQMSVDKVCAEAIERLREIWKTN